MKTTRSRGGAILLLATVIVAAGGCTGPNGPAGSVGPPLSLLLPKTIKIHPFTGTRTFDEKGGIKGIEVRIQLLDAYRDATKGFGDFRFELYEFRPHSQDRKGRRIAMWQETLMEPEKNLLHWDKLTRAYKFKLQWDQPISVGERFILTAVFASPYTERLFAERQFVAGQ